MKNFINDLLNGHELVNEIMFKKVMLQNAIEEGKSDLYLADMLTTNVSLNLKLGVINRLKEKEAVQII